MTKTSVDAAHVHEVLAKHILTDGYQMVLDLENSHGPYLKDAKSGKEYLDFFTFFASNPLGMNHPKVAGDDDFRARINRVAIHNPSNSDIYTREMAEFVDTFDRVGIPSYLPNAFFIAGGGLAVENALKVAFDWKVQKNFQKGYRQEKGHMIMHFDEAFHGRTGYTMSLTNTEPNKVAYFPKFNWPRVSNPKAIYPMTNGNIADVELREKLALSQAERYFELYKDDIAAIIIEPIQGEGGDNHFRLEFHKALRMLADRHDALLVYDEVQTGVGLTGKFWAHEHYVKPDIIAFGKKAQVCGILVGNRIDEVEHNVFRKSSRINSTWGGNLVDMVRFQRYLEIIEEDKLVEHAAETGEFLLNQLLGFSNEYEDYISNVRGRGLMCAFDFPEAHSRNEFIKAAFNHGLMILPCGHKSVRFRPPLNITKDQIEQGMEIVHKSLDDCLNRCPVVSHEQVAKAEAKDVAKLD